MIPRLDYELYCRDLVTNTPIRHEDIYFYNKEVLGVELSTEFQKLFDFYQGWINQQKKYGVMKGAIFFNPATSVNAKATRYNDYFIMTINKGTVVTLWREFQRKDYLLLLPGLENLLLIQQKSDYPINELMFQLCCHFTFYHELGHFIQKSDLLEQGLREDVNNLGGFDSYRHLLEYDADVFSSICLGTHVYQYTRDWVRDLKKGEAELVIAGVVSSIFVYMMMFESVKIPFYLKRNTHPHPFVRLLGIIHFITDYIRHIDEDHRVLNLDIGVIYAEFVTYSKTLSRELLSEQVSQIIDGFIRDSIREAGEYNNELSEVFKAHDELAVNKRNQIARDSK